MSMGSEDLSYPPSQTLGGDFNLRWSMTSFSYIELDVIYSRCQCLRVAYLFLFLIDMGSCDSHFILLELWLPTCGVEVVTSTNLFSE